MFQLTKGEYEILTSSILRSQIVTANIEDDKGDSNLRSQIVTAKEFTMSRTLPYAFTEHGVAMLSSVLRSHLPPTKISLNCARTLKSLSSTSKTYCMTRTTSMKARARSSMPSAPLWPNYRLIAQTTSPAAR